MMSVSLGLLSLQLHTVRSICGHRVQKIVYGKDWIEGCSVDPACLRGAEALDWVKYHESRHSASKRSWILVWIKLPVLELV